jgi:hypothetical protein
MKYYRVLQPIVLVAFVLGGLGLSGVSSAGKLTHPVPVCKLTLDPPTATFTLRYTSPLPTFRVHEGQAFIVVVPAWGSGKATGIRNSNPGAITLLCSKLTARGSRTSVYLAMHSGTSKLWATVTPATNLFMPSWSGTIKVSAKTK